MGESFLGPSAGSLLFAAAAAPPFGLDAASFAGSAVLVATLPGSFKDQDAQRPRICAQIAEGLRWLARHRLLRVVAVLLGMYNFANQVGQAILVLLATVTLHAGTRGYGFLLAAVAVGSVAGGLLCPRLTRRLGLLPSLIIAGAVDAAVFAGIGLAPDAAVAAVMLAGQGFAVTMWNVVTVSLRQQVVPRAPARPGEQRLPHARLGPDAAGRAGRRLRRARGGLERPLCRGGGPLRPVPARCPAAAADRHPARTGTVGPAGRVRRRCRPAPRMKRTGRRTRRSG